MKITKYLLILSFVLFASSWECDPSGLDEDITDAMNVHNEAREEVGVNAVVWSSSLANDAEEYAQKLAKSGRFEHSKTEDGENLYWYSSTHHSPMTEASASWYEELQLYRYRKCCGPNFSDTGHYTQMVWEIAPLRVGMGVGGVRFSGETYVVATIQPRWKFHRPISLLSD